MHGSRAAALPSVRRARGRYVYGHDGQRYLDCYLNDGRGILGHRPPRVSTVVKDVISTGRYAEYPSEFEHRMRTELSRILGRHWSVGLYACEGDALSVVGALTDRSPVRVDPVVAAVRGRRYSGVGKAAVGDCEVAVYYWRPYLDHVVDLSDAEFVLPVVPFPGRWAGQPLCSRRRESLPAGEPLSPVGLSGQVRALQTLHAVLTELRSRDESTSRSTGADPGPVLRPTKPPPLSIFRGRGPYLVPICTEEEYEGVFYTFLRNGIILHPDYWAPSIWSAEDASHDAKTFAELDAACARELGLPPAEPT